MLAKIQLETLGKLIYVKRVQGVLFQISAHFTVVL